MKSIDKLVQASKEGKESLQIGNHRMGRYTNTTYFYYFQTAICVYNRKTGKVKYNNGGWNTASTNRAINAYKKYFS